MNTKKYEKIIEKEKKLTEEYLKYLKENYSEIMIITYFLRKTHLKM